MGLTRDREGYEGLRVIGGGRSWHLCSILTVGLGSPLCGLPARL